MESFCIIIYHNEEPIIVEPVVTTAVYIGAILEACQIIADHGNAREYKIFGLTHFGSKDPEKWGTVEFEPGQILEWAEAARYAKNSVLEVGFDQASTEEIAMVYLAPVVG